MIGHWETENIVKWNDPEGSQKLTLQKRKRILAELILGITRERDVRHKENASFEIWKHGRLRIGE